MLPGGGRRAVPSGRRTRRSSRRSRRGRPPAVPARRRTGWAWRSGTGPWPAAAGLAAIAAAVTVTALVVVTHRPAAPALPRRGGPPWSRPADTATGVHLAGLSMSRSAGQVTRYYLHVDVFVDGRRVPVPANLGVDGRDGEICALHTGDSSGIVQVESNAEAPRYTLGQLFDIWQVPLSATQLGGLRSGRRQSLAAYVNGQRFAGDPRRITLAPQQEIAIEFGTGPFRPPAGYQFPPAE